MCCGVGSWGGERPSLADYVMVTGPRERGDRRQTALMSTSPEADAGATRMLGQVLAALGGMAADMACVG